MGSCGLVLPAIVIELVLKVHVAVGDLVVCVNVLVLGDHATSWLCS